MARRATRRRNAYPYAAAGRTDSGSHGDEENQDENGAPAFRGRGAARREPFSAEHLQTAADRLHAWQGLHGVRRQRQEVSGFSWRYRRQCPGLRAPADRPRDSARGGPRDPPFEPLPQRVPGTPGAQTGEVVGNGPRVFLEQRHRSYRGRAQTRAARDACKGRRGCSRAGQGENFGAGKFVSWANVWRAGDYLDGEIPRTVRAAAAGRCICPLQRCRRSRSKIRRPRLRHRHRSGARRGRGLSRQRSVLEPRAGIGDAIRRCADRR